MVLQGKVALVNNAGLHMIHLGKRDSYLIPLEALAAGSTAAANTFTSRAISTKESRRSPSR
jgi:hypothetical protein